MNQQILDKDKVVEAISHLSNNFYIYPILRDYNFDSTTFEKMMIDFENDLNKKTIESIQIAIRNVLEQLSRTLITCEVDNPVCALCIDSENIVLKK